MKTYAGIGARVTPAFVLEQMKGIAQIMDEMGWHLRSGGAHGADTAFASGTNNKTIYVPWDGYNEIYDGVSCSKQSTIEDAYLLASHYHPNWGACSEAVRKLHVRNIYIMGSETGKDPVDCVICWTEGGKVVGGTGMALRIAIAHNIPIFNLATADCLDRLEAFIVSKG